MHIYEMIICDLITFCMWDSGMILDVSEQTETQQ